MKFMGKDTPTDSQVDDWLDNLIIEVRHGRMSNTKATSIFKSKLAEAEQAARLDQMQYVDQRLIGKDTTGERVFYDKDAVIAENRLKAQQRIISDAMKADLQQRQALNGRSE